MSPPPLFVATSEPEVGLNMFLIRRTFPQLQEKLQGPGNAIINNKNTFKWDERP